MPVVFVRRQLVIMVMVSALFIITHAQESPAEPSATPRPAPLQVANDGRAALALYFDSLPQGGTGVAQVYGEGVTSARFRFQSSVRDFYPAADGFYTLIAIGLDTTPRTYPLSVSVGYADGTRSTIEVPITVTLGGFVRQSFSVAADRAYLTAPEVERAEYARMESIFAGATDDKLWSAGGFILPMDSEITSPFGAFRTLNENTQTRHTGWDFRAVPGTPIRASADGVIAFAGPMDIRGNYVMIDHGFGVFSGYAHFSQIHVTRGQQVQQGQIIGVSGNTGRSNGPHLHWEIAIHGQWIDSVAFTQMWLP